MRVFSDKPDNAFCFAECVCINDWDRFIEPAIKLLQKSPALHNKKYEIVKINSENSFLIAAVPR
jgi:hypothetical protein